MKKNFIIILAIIAFILYNNSRSSYAPSAVCDPAVPSVPHCAAVYSDVLMNMTAQDPYRHAIRTWYNEVCANNPNPNYNPNAPGLGPIFPYAGWPPAQPQNPQQAGMIFPELINQMICNPIQPAATSGIISCHDYTLNSDLAALEATSPIGLNCM
jgi:hypothetical protein